MTGPLLDDLLQRMMDGDVGAAEQIFGTYEPYLRMVVRRQLTPALRAKFDSLDVVQSVWVHLLRGFRSSAWRFQNADHLRAFLVQLTRHRFIDRLRRHRRMLEHEEPLGKRGIADSRPTADEETSADELWERLLELSPPSHHEILRLKRDGAATAEVAEQTGFNPGSIRRILHQLARQLDRAERAAAAGAGRRP